ncbi:MAG: TolC family protein, partial [Gammaproteobacteria bacterium]|nr:TolC family protein [Gammaproteobacteria bacterium]
MHKFTRVAVALMLTGIVSACAVGPDYQAPDNVSTIELTTSYQTADAVKSWWQAFEDETLSSLIELALTENRSLHEALANVRRAQAVFSESGAQRWPQGSVSAGYQAVENTSLLDADDGVQLRGFNTGLSLNWDADLAGKLVRAEQAALARAEQADLLWRDAQLQVISQVVNSYGQYRGAQI